MPKHYKYQSVPVIPVQDKIFALQKRHKQTIRSMFHVFDRLKESGLIVTLNVYGGEDNRILQTVEMIDNANDLIMLLQSPAQYLAKKYQGTSLHSVKQWMQWKIDPDYRFCNAITHIRRRCRQPSQGTRRTHAWLSPALFVPGRDDRCPNHTEKKR